ncbi:MAG: class I tRNA ligase family protein [Caulobacterales bacterium]|nr:class I tRNA ligase family protein [Caulobacterales bacterium]
MFVAETAEEAVAQASDYYRERVEELADGAAPRVGVRYIKRDEDVLDTWFSSALWPFSTMGWPDKTPELKRFYPTSVLVTAFDIIFFWVARMMMQGLQFMGEVPFREVYIHALVRDEAGQKMSKSKGNVLDPLDFVDGCALDDLIAKRLDALPRREDPKRAKEEADRVAQATKKQFPNGVERCGADALRFTLAAMATQGRDIRLSAERVVGYRNFGTKVWNAARLLQMNGVTAAPAWDPASARETVNRWIVTEIVDTAAKVTAELEAYRFNEAAGAVYRFAWHVFCDWYLEIIKPAFDAKEEGGEPDPAIAETRACAGWAFDQLLKLLHPFSPFITEELWEKTAGDAGRRNLLIAAAWPELPGELRDEEAVAEMDWTIRLVTEIRSVRAEMNVPPAARLPVRVFDASKRTRARLKRREADIARLARLKDVKAGRKEVSGAVQTVLDEARVVLALKDHIDIDAEAARLAGEIAKVEGEIARLDKKLSNEKFVAKAPADVVAAEREKQADYAAQKSKLETALGRVREMA